MSEHGPLSDAFMADDASFVIPVRLMELAEARGLMQATITQTLEAVFAEIDSLRAPGADLYEAVLDAVRTEPLLGCGCCADYSEVRCEHGYVVHSDEADEAGDYCNPGDRRELIARRIAERLGAFEDRTGQTRQALERIAGWDMLNPPSSFSDAEWLRSVVEKALGWPPRWVRGLTGEWTTTWDPGTPGDPR